MKTTGLFSGEIFRLVVLSLCVIVSSIISKFLDRLFSNKVYCNVIIIHKILIQTELTCIPITFLSISGSRVQMSCRDTGGPTPGSSPTSALYVRKSLLVVTTCPNILRSTAFHEAPGRCALQTDSSLITVKQTLAKEAEKEYMDVCGSVCDFKCVSFEKKV